MQLSAGMRHVRMILSPIARQSLASSRISASSPFRSLHTLSSSPLRPELVRPPLYRRFPPALHLSIWPGAKENGSHTNSSDAGTLAPDATVLRPLGGTDEAVSPAVRQKLMDDFLAGVDKFDPAPVQYSLRWWFRILYEAEPRRCITLVVPDEESRKAAREALRVVCKRWDGWVGALRSSYVCIVVMRNTFDDLRDDLQYNSELGFKGEARVYCAVASRHEMDPISASSGLQTHIEASDHNEGEERRLLLLTDVDVQEGITVDDRTVEDRRQSRETTAASPNNSYLNKYRISLAWLLKRFACCAVVIIAGTACLTHLVPRTTCGCDVLHGGSSHEQEQHHGESHNRGKSKQNSALEVRHGDIQATGDVDNSTHIHHGCEANPLSSSSPTVGNNQPNGNEGLTQKQ